MQYLLLYSETVAHASQQINEQREALQPPIAGLLTYPENRNSQMKAKHDVTTA